MLEEIRSFFDELRAQRRLPPPEVPSSDPREAAFQQVVRAILVATKKILDETDDHLENWLVGIYETGADDLLHIEFLDRVMAIIHKRHLAPDMRLREIAGLLTRPGATAPRAAR